MTHRDGASPPDRLRSDPGLEQDCERDAVPDASRRIQGLGTTRLARGAASSRGAASATIVAATFVRVSPIAPSHPRPVVKGRAEPGNFLNPPDMPQ